MAKFYDNKYIIAILFAKLLVEAVLNGTSDFLHSSFTPPLKTNAYNLNYTRHSFCGKTLRKSSRQRQSYAFRINRLPAQFGIQKGFFNFALVTPDLPSDGISLFWHFSFHFFVGVLRPYCRRFYRRG